MGGSGGGYAIQRLRFPLGRAVGRLYPQISLDLPNLQSPIVKFPDNPYRAVNPAKAMILMGRNKEGKTTLLATAIPWYRRLWLFSYRGIYLSGALHGAHSSLEKWEVLQMRGNLDRGVSLHKALQDYRAGQWGGLRTAAHNAGVPWVRPRVPFVVVDQFEELLKRWPKEGLEWASAVANFHVRGGLARVIFVLNSENAAQSLLSLNQGVRFERWKLEPLSAEAVKGVAGMDVDRFEACQRNIGMYKEAPQGTDADGLKAEVENKLLQWEQDNHLAHPVHYNRAWLYMSDVQCVGTLVQCVEGAHPGVGEQLRGACGGLSGPDIVHSPVEDWVKLLGGDQHIAVARKIVEVLSLPPPPAPPKDPQQ